MYRKFFKRLLDVLLSLTAIIILSPVYIFLAILVHIKLGSPVIFKQERPGRNEKIFKMYKFRSMTDEKDDQGILLPDDMRLTSFGKKLRATSLDELPELFNVLKGEMSLVGPRPLLIKDMIFMTQNERKRHLVRQGLTGLAQVNGRNNISWEEKLNFDIEYVNNITFFNDMFILMKTISKVILKRDISTDGMETAEDLGDYLLRTNRINEVLYDEIINEYKEYMEK